MVTAHIRSPNLSYPYALGGSQDGLRSGIPPFAKCAKDGAPGFIDRREKLLSSEKGAAVQGAFDCVRLVPHFAQDDNAKRAHGRVCATLGLVRFTDTLYNLRAWLA